MSEKLSNKTPVARGYVVRELLYTFQCVDGYCCFSARGYVVRELLYTFQCVDGPWPVGTWSGSCCTRSSVLMGIVVFQPVARGYVVRESLYTFQCVDVIVVFQPVARGYVVRELLYTFQCVDGYCCFSARGYVVRELLYTFQCVDGYCFFSPWPVGTWSGSRCTRSCVLMGIVVFQPVARGYVVRESLYTFHCCGVITSWEIRAGYTGAIELMVWQSMGGDNERLVGKNVRVIASVNPPGGEELGELLTFNIPEAEQIIVEPGYRIGWYCSDLDILVAYAKGGASFDNNYYMEDMTNTNVGETVTLEKQDNDRTFAIKAYTAQGSVPTLSGLPTDVTIASDLPQGSTLYVPVVVNTNSYDTFTFSETGVVSIYFAVDSVTGAVTVASSDYVCYKGSPGLSHTNQSSYTLTAHCTDGYNTINSTVVILVLQNQSPVITNLPGAVTVSAKLTATSVTVFSVSASDPDDNITTVSMTCSACPFIMYPDGRIVTTKSLEDETVGSYMLSVSVADSRNTVGPALLTIVLTDHNSAPSFSNLPKTLFVPETAIPGSRLYQLSFSDPDVNDTPTVSVHTLLPTSGGILFGFNSSDTTVYLLSSATLDYEYLTDHNFTIVYVVTDGITSSTSSLEILILDENEAPSFSSTTYYISTPEADVGSSCI
ncbi:protocadherin-16-like [Argopecten irradians]|uniref:protocadherin-16-like n=1 Tax=Argopecten irradians TaxID=31199 RepID=UPI003712E7AB